VKIPRRNGFATENMDTSEISGDIPIPCSEKGRP
jgi:hypothetical protein